jgi:hypothetical protein
MAKWSLGKDKVGDWPLPCEVWLLRARKEWEVTLLWPGTHPCGTCPWHLLRVGRGKQHVQKKLSPGTTYLHPACRVGRFPSLPPPSAPQKTGFKFLDILFVFIFCLNTVYFVIIYMLIITHYFNIYNFLIKWTVNMILKIERDRLLWMEVTYLSRARDIGYDRDVGYHHRRPGGPAGQIRADHNFIRIFIKIQSRSL